MSEDGPRGVADLAREIGVAASTAHRLLATLVARGYAVQLVDRSYDVGPALLAPGYTRGQGAVVSAVRPFLEQLHELVDETCQVLVRSGADVTFADAVESDQMLRVSARTGMRIAAWSTSGGKAMLAELRVDEAIALYEATAGSGPGSRRNRSDLEQELATIRRTGLGTNDNESERGVSAIGVSLGTVSGQQVALAVSVPSVRMTSANAKSISSALHAVAAKARARFGPRVLLTRSQIASHGEEHHPTEP